MSATIIPLRWNLRVIQNKNPHWWVQAQTMRTGWGTLLMLGAHDTALGAIQAAGRYEERRRAEVRA